MNKLCSLIFTLVFTFASLAFAELPVGGPATNTNLDAAQKAAVEAYVAKWSRTTALSVALIRDSDKALLFSRCYGWDASPQNADAPGKGCDENSVFGLASMSKEVTSKMIGILVSQGVVSLDQPVFCVPIAGRLRAGCILDNVVSHNGTWPAMIEDVTVRHLREHTAGMDDGFIGTGGDRGTASRIGAVLPITKAQWASFNAVNWQLYRQPGTQFGYSNTGYFYLSMIIEKVTGLGYEAAMHSLVTRPLGIRDEDMKVCVNQKTNWEPSSGVLPTRGHDYRQVWKNPLWDIFTAPEMGRSEYDTADTKLYPNTEDSYRLETRDGTFGLCATAYAYALFASSTSGQELGQLSSGQWITAGKLPGVGALAHAHVNGYTTVVLVNADQRIGTESTTVDSSGADLHLLTDPMETWSASPSLSQVNLWGNVGQVTVKSYRYIGPTFNNDGKPRYFMTSVASNQAAVESLTNFTLVETFKAFPMQKLRGNDDMNNVCRWFAPGVSSHFYSPKKSDCELLGWLYPDKDNSGLFHEASEFAVKKVNTSGGCDVGYVPLYRAFGPSTSNHRYTISLTVIAEMKAEGWNDEGIQGCVLPQ